MILETLALVAAWHPNHENDYEYFTPGLILNVSPERELVTPYLTAGVYRDSFKKFAYLYGVGVDVGETYGVGLTIAHIQGSGCEKSIFCPVPSLFYRANDYTTRLILSPDAIAIGFSYSFH